MSVAIMTTIFFIVGYLLTFMKKQLPYVENAILFLWLSTLSFHLFTILTMQLEWIVIKDDPYLFLYPILKNKLITPVLFVIFINVYLTVKSIFSKVILIMLVIVSLILFDYISIQLDVFYFKQWNYLYTSILGLLFIIGSLGSVKLFSFINSKEVRR